MLSLLICVSLVVHESSKSSSVYNSPRLGICIGLSKSIVQIAPCKEYFGLLSNTTQAKSVDIDLLGVVLFYNKVTVICNRIFYLLPHEHNLKN